VTARVRSARPEAIGAATAILLATAAGAAPRAWTGVIGDSMCGASHAMDGGGNEMADAACVISCVKNGEKFVLVDGGRSWEIENQDFAGLPLSAGIRVRLDGELDGERIRVTRIEPLEKPKAPDRK
jgi:hypothetical protein